MRIAGGILVILGLLLSVTIFGAFIGIPLILIGLVMFVAGGRRKTVITNVVQVTNSAGGGRWNEPPPAPSNRVALGHRDEPDYLAPPARRASSLAGPSVTDRLQPSISQMPSFRDIESEITQQSINILRAAKSDGFEVQYLRNDNLVVVRRQGEASTRLYSNDDIVEFGRSHGLRG